MKHQAFLPHFVSMSGWCWVVGGGVGGGEVGYGVVGVGGWSMAVYGDRWWVGVVLRGLTLGGDQ